MAHDKIAATAGWKSKSSVKTHLDMLSILPEPVKVQIRDGDVSASLAVKIAKENPELVEKMIRENKEENKRLGVGARMKNRVTPKTLKRDRPKAEPQHAGVVGSIVRDEAPLPDARNPYDERAPSLPPQSPQGDAEPAQDTTPLPAPLAAHLDLLPVLIELTRHAKHALELNQSDEAPGYWTQDLVDAVRVAERVIGLCGNGHDPYQVFDAAVEETKALAVEGA